MADQQRSLWNPRTWPRTAWVTLVLLGLLGSVGAAWFTNRFLVSRTAGVKGTLRSIVASNESFKRCNVVDQDADGMGEYGWLGEMAGTEAVRGSGLTMSTSPFVAAVLGVKDKRGRSRKSGYVFHLALPLANNRWQLEPQKLPPEPWGSVPPEQSDARETHWLCYAWPDTDNITIKRAYFVTESGEIWVTNGAGKQYRGDDGPRVSAAFVKGGQGPPGGAQAPSYTGTDGNIWRLLDQ